MYLLAIVQIHLENRKGVSKQVSISNGHYPPVSFISN